MEFADKVYKKLEETKKEHLKSLAENYFKANENMLAEIKSIRQEDNYKKGFVDMAMSIKGVGLASLAKKALGKDLALNVIEKASWATALGGLTYAGWSTLDQSPADSAALITATAGAIASLAVRFAKESRDTLVGPSYIEKTQQQMEKMLDKFSEKGSGKISVESFADMIEDIHVNDKSLVASITHFSEKPASESKLTSKGPKLC